MQCRWFQCEAHRPRRKVNMRASPIIQLMWMPYPNNRLRFRHSESSLVPLCLVPCSCVRNGEAQFPALDPSASSLTRLRRFMHAQVAVLGALVELGSDVNMVDQKGLSPLDRAAGKGVRAHQHIAHVQIKRKCLRLGLPPRLNNLNLCGRQAPILFVGSILLSFVCHFQSSCEFYTHFQFSK